MRLPLLDKDNPTSVDMPQVYKMIDLFMEKGFNYFDTGYLYIEEKSEGILKKALVDRYPRETFKIADKLPLSSITKAEQMEPIFNEQLARCGVDYFDYYLLHFVCSSTKDAFTKIDSFGFVKDKKEKGLVKHMGMSFHDSAEMLDDLLNEHPEIEFIQLQINYLDWESDVVQSKKCYEVAKKHNIPVIVMEPVKGGSLSNIPQEAEKLLKDYNSNSSLASWALRFCRSLENVQMVLSGMGSIGQIEENTDLFDNFKPLNKEEYDLLDKASEIINKSVEISCTNCGYCLATCPKHIPISRYFKLYNTEKYLNSTDEFNQEMYYKIIVNTGKYGKASDCIECGTCIKHCPQHLQIPELLKNVVKQFEKEDK